MRIGVSYQTKTGRLAVYFQIYATDGEIVGNATFTTIQEEPPSIGPVMADLIRSLSFHSQQSI